MTRTRATYLVYAVLGFYGWFIYGFGPVVPLLRDEQGTSRAVASLHGTALAVGALAAGALYPFLTRRIGRARTLWTALGGLAFGIVVLAVVPSVPVVTIAATLGIGTVGAILVNSIAPTLLSIHGPAFSGAALTEGNAIACGVGLVAPLAIGFSLDQGFGWRPALLVASVLAAVIAVLARATATGLPTATDQPPDPGPPPPAAGSPAAGSPAAGSPAAGTPAAGTPAAGTPAAGTPAAGTPAVETPAVGKARLPRRFWVTWVIMLCCIAAEFATTLWASDVLRHRTGSTAALATAAVTAVVGGMCGGRIVGAVSAARAPGAVLLLPALGIALIGGAVFWVTTSPVVAIVGLAILGFGLGPTYPLAMDLAMQASDGQPDRAAGYASYAAGLAVGSGPFALGALADLVGPHGAFLVVPALFLVAIAGVVVISPRARPR
ncbi:MFS transporter [Cryptosporangium japonicum]|uniref:Major facilitator superfamily (MFS) profile domain-containing protein n=1 Tax=Cryptosporangium japonicum TaxID=80872 RepID=A0ABP3DDA8_9ACTN